MTSIRLYLGLIAAGNFAAIAGAYYNNLLLTIGGAAWSVFWLAAEIGVVIHEYRAMARLMILHDKLLIASIKAQGFELEGFATFEEIPEETQRIKS